MEIVVWLIRSIAETVIRYGVSKVLDFILKRH